MALSLHRLAGTAVLLAASCAPSSTESPALVVLLVIDTLRADSLGCYGHEGDPTPRIDALARDGTRFEQAISASGWTLPSMASLLTGAWPSVHKAMGKNVLLTALSRDVPTAAEMLADEGFHTAAIANAAFVSPLLGLDRGFATFDHRHAYNAEIRRADASIDDALAALEAHREEPVFLLIHLFDPHLDYDPPDGVPGERTAPLPISMQACARMMEAGTRNVPGPADVEWVKAAYRAEVSSVDRAVGRFVDALQAEGLYDDALIVLTSDHGEEFWDHRGFEHGHSLYDELVRVPLIVKPPAHAQVAVRSLAAQVRVLDVMPTVFDVVGVEAPESFEGASLLPAMRGQQEGVRLAFSESTLYGPSMRALRDERYKYIRSENKAGGIVEQVYDWRTDPGETRNLVTSEPELAAKLRKRFEAFTRELDARAARTRPGKLNDMHPKNFLEYQQSLEALGYTGRDEE